MPHFFFQLTAVYKKYDNTPLLGYKTEKFLEPVK